MLSDGHWQEQPLMLPVFRYQPQPTLDRRLHVIFRHRLTIDEDLSRVVTISTEDGPRHFRSPRTDEAANPTISPDVGKSAGTDSIRLPPLGCVDQLE